MMRSLSNSPRRGARALHKAIKTVTTPAQARKVSKAFARMGASPAQIIPTVEDSPNYRDGRFQSYEPSLRLRPKAQTSGILAAVRVHKRGKPPKPVPLDTPEFPETAGDLAVTWLGHATCYLELDGVRILIDPVFGDRVSPLLHAGPKRLHPVPVDIAGLPAPDVVLISHDHYDHLDHPSILELEEHHQPHYLVPLGVEAHLTMWGVPTDRITRLDWRESTEVDGVTFTATEARHNSGRGIVDSQTLWCGWAMKGPRHTVYYSGDSGTSKRFATIGAELGPFDLTILPIGAYDPFWPDIHMDPMQAVAAHRDVNRIGDDATAQVEDSAGVADDAMEGDQRIDTPGGSHEEGEEAERTKAGATTKTDAQNSLMLPVHWATFNLSWHWWAEPIRQVLAAAKETQVPVVTPRLGRRLDLDAGGPEQAQEHWWLECADPEDRDEDPDIT